MAVRAESTCFNKQSDEIPELLTQDRSPAQVSERLDDLIKDLRTRFHEHAIGQPKGSVKEPYDVLIVAHGHILRAFATRWIGKDIAENPSMLLEAGGVGTLSYEHKNIEEPAILLGGAFMSDVVENAKDLEREKEKERQERRKKMGDGPEVNDLQFY